MKLFTILSLILIITLLFSCQPAQPEEADDETLTDDLAEIDTLEEDLGLDELDEIDQMLAELES